MGADAVGEDVSDGEDLRERERKREKKREKKEREKRQRKVRRKKVRSREKKKNLKHEKMKRKKPKPKTRTLIPASRITLLNSACAALAASRFTGLSYSEARGCKPPIIRLVPSGSQTITTSAGSFSCSCLAAPKGGIFRWWCWSRGVVGVGAGAGFAIAVGAAAGAESASDSSGCLAEGGGGGARDVGPGLPAPPSCLGGRPKGLRAPRESGATAATSLNEAE